MNDQALPWIVGAAVAAVFVLPILGLLTSGDSPPTEAPTMSAPIESTTDTSEDVASVAPTATQEESADATTDSQSTPSAGASKRYMVESGMVVYDVSGVHAGQETLYWDDWGLREARYTKTTMSMMGVTQDTDTWTITLGEKMYAIDQNANTMSTLDTSEMGAFVNMSDAEMKQMADQMMKAMGSKRIGSDYIADQSCEVWATDFGNAETCLWMGVTLSEKAEMMGMKTNKVAVSAVPNYAVDEKHFEVPTGLPTTDLTSGLTGTQ